ncbi:MAG: hypothetical protein K8L99_06410, partial [Anaerolineae bacterium]|nr:hypothetical protein [Anaerolineae bacterium]
MTDIVRDTAFLISDAYLFDIANPYLVSIIEVFYKKKNHFFLTEAALQLEFGIRLETLLQGAWK